MLAQSFKSFLFFITLFLITNVGRATPLDLLSETKTGGQAYDIVIDEYQLYAFVADGEAGFKVIDIFEPKKPVEAVYYNTPGFAMGVAFSDPYLYVADGFSGFLVFDVTDPQFPVLVGSYQTEDFALDVVVYENRAYVVTEELGLLILDITHPEEPKFLSFYNTSEPIRDVAVSKDYAYIAAGKKGLEVLDITDSKNPVLVGAIDPFSSSGSSENVFLSGTTVFLADEEDGLHLIDIFDPENPEVISTFNKVNKVFRAMVTDDMGFLVTDEGLAVIDISKPKKPFLLGKYLSESASTGIGVYGNFVFMTDALRGVDVFSFEEIFSSLKKSVFINHETTLNTSGLTRSIVVEDDYAFVATQDSVMIIDVLIPEEPLFMSMIDQAHPQDMALKGNKLYVANGVNGLTVIDVENKEKPASLGVKLLQSAYGITIQGDHAYIGAGENGFYVVDISDPDSLNLVGSCSISDSSSFATKIVVDKNYAYVAAGEAGLIVVDIKNPENPLCTKTFALLGDTRDVVLSGHLAYVADGSGGVKILDVINPLAPELLGSYSTKGEATSLALEKNSLYVADFGGEGVVELNVRNPEQMTLIHQSEDSRLLDARVVHLTDSGILVGSNAFYVLGKNEIFLQNENDY